MDSRLVWRIVGTALIIAGLVLLIYVLRDVLTPVLIALLLAYLLDPAIDRMEKWKLNRTVSILVLAVLVLAVMGTIGGFLIFQAQQELVAFYHNLPEYFEKLESNVLPWIEETFGVRLPHTLDELIKELQAQVTSLDPEALKPVSSILVKISSSTLALISWVVGLLIIPIFLFYFLRDWDLLIARIAGLIPSQYRDYVFNKAAEMDAILGAFIRGQLTIAVILGILYSIGLLLVGIDLAVVIGMGAGILFIVPYLGTILGIIAATLIALLEFGFAWQVLGVWGVFAVVQFFEGSILTPKIMGDKVGLSPVAVIFTLLVGAELMGLTGMLVAVPAAAVLNVFIKEAVEKYRNAPFMQQADGVEGDQTAHQY